MPFDEAIFCTQLPTYSFTNICDELYTGYQEHGKELIIRAQTLSAIVERWSQIALSDKKITLIRLFDIERWLTVLPYFEKSADKGLLITQTSTILFETRIPSRETLEGMLLNLPGLTNSLSTDQRNYLLLAIDFLIEQHNAEKKARFSANTITPILSYLLKKLPANTERDWLCGALINAIDKEDNQELLDLAEIICTLGDVKPCPMIDYFLAALWPQVLRELSEGKKLAKDSSLEKWMLKYTPQPETVAYKMATRLFPFLKEKFEEEAAKAKAQPKIETKETETTVVLEEEIVSLKPIITSSQRKNRRKSHNRFSSLLRSSSKIGLQNKDGSLTLRGEKTRPSLVSAETATGSQ